MKLILSIDARNLSYSFADHKGEGLEGLIREFGNNEFDIIEISGESKSYTFLRQIALLINLSVKVQNSKVELKSPSFETGSDNTIFPIYE